MTFNAARVAEILGGKKALKREVRSLEDLRDVVEAGLPRQSLDAAVSRVVSGDRAANQLAHALIPRSTLKRVKTHFNPRQSEHVERLARMTALAEQVWEDSDLAHEFLTSEQPQLRGARPVDLALSDLGTHQVEQLLARLEYSLPA